MVAAPPGGSLPRSFGETSYPEGPRNRRGAEGWAYAPLGTGVQVIRLSPCRAGLAGRRRTRLRTPPASTACSCPLWLSPPGKPLTRRSSFRTSSASGRNGPSDETAHPHNAGDRASPPSLPRGWGAGGGLRLAHDSIHENP